MSATVASRAVTMPRWRPRITSRVVLFVLVIAVYTLFGIARQAMYNEQLVVFPLLRDITIYTVVGLAQLCALSIGHMNLAVGRMAAVGAMVAGASYDKLQMPLGVGLIACLAAGAVVGGLTGWLIARSGVSSFVVTLAMDFALLGFVSLIYTSFTTGAAFTTKPAGMAELRSYSFGQACVGNLCGSTAVPQLILFALIPMALVGYLYSRSRMGRELLMVGSNVVAAELSGLPTRSRVILAHCLSGTLAALAGFLLAVSTGSFKATIGDDFMLPSFLGPVLGGTLLAGGAVSVVGTALGTTLVLVIRRGLTLLNVGLEDLNIYLGLVLLVALSTDRIRSLVADRKAVRLR
jgi:ribose transport system permease protein